MRRVPIRPVSDRRRRRDRDYPQARMQVWERAEGRCEAVASQACTGRCEQVHHVAGRDGPDPHRLDLLLGVCAPCHQHIHRHVIESFSRGWMRRRNGVQP